MNYFTDEIYGEEPLASLTRFSDEGLFDALMGRFPVGSSQIDWDEVEGSETWKCSTSTGLSKLWDQVLVPRLQASQSVLHVGDNLSEFGINIPSDRLRQLGLLVLEIPEHHYFLSICGRVLVVVTTEGNIDSVRLDPPLAIAGLSIAAPSSSVATEDDPE